MNLHKTKIVCTIGPSSDSIEIIEELIKSGMNVARINLSHGKEADHLNIISNIRNVSKKLDSSIPILADLPGPKYRLGEIKNNSLDLNIDDELFLNCGNSNKEELSVWPPGLHLDVKKGAVLLVDDGAVELEITEINKTIIKTKVKLAGKITSNKAVVPRGLPS